MADDPTFVRGPAKRSERQHLLLAVATTALITVSATAVASWSYRSGHPLLAVASTLVHAALLAVALRRHLAVATAADHSQSVLRAQLTRIAEAQRRVANAEAAERHRIERDLHDGVQQHLLALDIRASLIEEAVAGTQTAAAVSEIRYGLREAHREVRGVAHGLHPTMLVQHGLGPALDQVLDQVRDNLGVATTLAVPDQRFAPGVERILYAGLGEALTNVVRHAQASSVSVAVKMSGDAVIAQVSDDGVGGARCIDGKGLARVADRACAAGGRVEVDSPLGTGTLVRIVLPCG